MNFTLSTPIVKDFKEVFNQFDQELFEFLLPPKKVAQLIEFGGSQKGAIVHIQFLVPFKTEWISEITEDKQRETECYFIDVGRKLPFGLKYWTHKHIVKKEGDQAIIVDDITYGYNNKVLDILFYPFWYLSFLPRKKQYRQFFEEGKRK
ncbi:MAG: hypothetical protein AB8B61_05195 [Cyclobacteriaceae bacterium]